MRIGVEVSARKTGTTHKKKRATVLAKAHTLACIDREISSENGRKGDNRINS
jgi:hypothetical protein